MNNKSLVFALTACFVGVLIYGLQRLDDWTSAAPTDGPGQVVPDARVSAALPPPLAELAGGGVRVHDDAPPVVEPEPVHVTGVRWARRDIDERARRGILARQEEIRRFIADIDGTVELEEERFYATSAMALTTYAVEVIFDATGRAVTIPMGTYDAEGRKTRFTIKTPDYPHHNLSSGGAKYLIPIGEFPAYDRIKELLKEYPKAEYPNGVPIGEVPFEDVLALGNLALSYRIQ